MRRAGFLLGLPVVCLIAGCTSPATTTSSSASSPASSAPPSAEAAGPAATSVVPVGAVPYDEHTAPAGFASRPPLPSCGATEDLRTSFPSPPTAHQAADDAVIACWLAAHRPGRSAEARIVTLTIDSGPAFAYLRTVGGRVEVWLSVKDRMIGPNAPVTWSHLRCAGVAPRNLAPEHCVDAA
jgi:hypothetical protein